MSNLIANPGRLIKVWAGRDGMFFDTRVRRWTVPTDDCVAWPTPEHYVSRWVMLSNQGNDLNHRWVALDRCFDEKWRERTYTVAECHEAMTTIRISGEWAEAGRRR